MVYGTSFQGGGENLLGGGPTSSWMQPISKLLKKDLGGVSPDLSLLGSKSRGKKEAASGEGGQRENVRIFDGSSKEEKRIK